MHVFQPPDSQVVLLHVVRLGYMRFGRNHAIYHSLPLLLGGCTYWVSRSAVHHRFLGFRVRRTWEIWAVFASSIWYFPVTASCFVCYLIARLASFALVLTRGVKLSGMCFGSHQPSCLWTHSSASIGRTAVRIVMYDITYITYPMCSPSSKVLGVGMCRLFPRMPV